MLFVEHRLQIKYLLALRQLFDFIVEFEFNGHLCFDRELISADALKFRESHDQALSAVVLEVLRF